MNRDLLPRYMIVILLLAIFPVGIVFRMVRIQTNAEQVEKIKKNSKRYEGYLATIRPARGLIYDRHGNLLAANTTAYEVGLDLAQVKNPETIALVMSAVAGMDYADALERANKKPGPNQPYWPLKDPVSEEVKKNLEAYKAQLDLAYGASENEQAPSLSGLVFTPHLVRTYPEKSLGSYLLGFVSRTGGEGFFGVEEKYNRLLAPANEEVFVSLDPNQAARLPEVTDGTSLVLTIDRSIQEEMENVLDQALDTWGAETGTIVVMDPHTGELLALATVPRIDLNEFENQMDVYPPGTPFNRGVSQSYEPGSVFKVLTMAAALDSGTVTPETTFVDTGQILIGGVWIHNWNYGAWGPQDMQGCMQHSLNVCLAWLAQQMGPKTFYEYMQRFNIGRLTGVDLAGEATGRLKSPGDEDWYEADLGTNAFGQGVAATPLQMAAAISAVANEGKMMTPHIVRSIITKNGQRDIPPQVSGTPITAKTANDLTQMLARSLEIESSDALVPGYRVAGKTGTAEIPTPYGYTSNQTNASFVGWGPVEDPQFLVYVWLEKPTGSIWGSEVAAPVFSQAVQQLVVLMDIPPDDVRDQLLGQ